MSKPLDVALAIEGLEHDLLSRSLLRQKVVGIEGSNHARAEATFVFNDVSNLDWVAYRTAIAKRLNDISRLVGELE